MGPALAQLPRQSPGRELGMGHRVQGPDLTGREPPAPVQADIFVGVNFIDYSGYPDCRPEFIAAFETLAALATKAGVQGCRYRINAPLIKMSKAEIVKTGARLGVDYATTVSCYQPDAAGAACGKCDACRLRAAGFAAAGVPDPTRYAPTS